MDLKIRDAEVSDAVTIASLLIASKSGSEGYPVENHDRDPVFWTERWRYYLAQGSRAQFALGDGFAIVAEVRGAAAGFAAHHHTRRFGAEAELQAIYVAPEMQRRGIGTRLLRVVASRLLAEGIMRVCVGYDPRNPFKRFYQRYGAVEINPHWAMWNDVGAIMAAEEATDPSADTPRGS